MNVLQVEPFGESIMHINMMTAVDAGKPKAKHFRTDHGFCEADISGAREQFLQ